MKHPIMIAAAALAVAAPSVSSASAADFIPWLMFDQPGNTYDPATLGVLSSWEGTHAMSGDMPTGGFVLTAQGTHLRNDYTKDLGGGVGLMTSPSESDGVTYCSAGLIIADDGGDTLTLSFPNPKAYLAPKRNGLVAKRKWKVTGCAETVYGTITATWPVAEGTEAWTVSKYRHVFRPEVSHRIWQGTDAFVNVCINEGKQTWSSGGQLYCTVVDRQQVDKTTYRLTQRTTITKRYPAYVAP